VGRRLKERQSSQKELEISKAKGADLQFVDVGDGKLVPVVVGVVRCKLEEMVHPCHAEGNVPGMAVEASILEIPRR
jgi:hypothetical protein